MKCAVPERATSSRTRSMPMKSTMSLLPESVAPPVLQKRETHGLRWRSSTWCDGAQPKSSQKTAHKCYKDVQIARCFWRFAIHCPKVVRFGDCATGTRGRRTVDEIDRQLISILRNDARTSVAGLAKALRVSRGTVQNRMARLEA